MAGGRPTDYRPEYCQMVVDHMARGLSFASFAGTIDSCEDTLHEWKKVHPEFSEAERMGRAKSMVFWEEMGVVGTTEGKNFNALSWKFNMQNRFRWTDRQDVTTDGEKVNTYKIEILDYTKNISPAQTENRLEGE